MGLHQLIVEERRRKLEAGADVISKAEAIIDGLIDAWPKSDASKLSVELMHKRVKTFMYTRKQYAWYNEHFTEGGWETLIATRLRVAGK